MFCRKCGAPLEEGARFCKQCGTPAEAETVKAKTKKEAAKKVEVATKQTVSAAFKEVNASKTAGEFMIGSAGGMSAVSEIVSPIKTVSRYFKSMGSGIKNIFTGKDIKGLIFFIVIAVAWITLGILAACGVNTDVTRILSSVTYAHGGGADRNILGFLGGLLGKTVFASSLIGIINGGAKYIGKGFKNSFDITVFKNVKQLKFLFIGSGIALCLLKVFAGYITVTDIMAPNSFYPVGHTVGRKQKRLFI